MKLLVGIIIGSVLGVALVLLFVPATFRVATDFLSLQVSSPRVISRLIEDAEIPANGFADQLSTVIAASNRYNADSIARNREHVGAILKRKLRKPTPESGSVGYFYTHGVGADHQAPVEFAIAKPKRCELIALWHTHGAEASDRHYFSPEDVRSADDLDVPIYMTNFTGRLKVYKPGQRKIGYRRVSRDGSLPMPRGAANGKLLSHTDGSSIRIRTKHAKSAVAAAQ
ncbi:MAG: DUF4329 domain-containing protein [Pseudomonadota bacterium]